jgi:Icc-related predicted phosphoesterase
MRILAVSDLRVQPLRELEAVVKSVEPDLILYAGDDVERFAARRHSWSALARKVPRGLAGIVGNDCSRRAKAALRQAACHDLHAKPLILEDLAIVGLEGAPASRDFGIGPTLYSEAESRRHLERMFASAGHLPVLLVSHAPPYGVLDFSSASDPKASGHEQSFVRSITQRFGASSADMSICKAAARSDEARS